MNYRKQIQKALDDSMRKRGQVYPIMVRRTGQHRYRLIDGLERILSLRRVGQNTVLTTVIAKDTDEREDGIHDLPISQISLKPRDESLFPYVAARRIETSRKDLARHLRRMIQRNPNSTMADIAERVSRSVSWLRKLLAEYPA